MNKFSISIIIPTLNEEEWIRKCIETVRTNAADKSIEIIVVDCGSNDQTLDQIPYWINCIELPKNKGFKSKSLNAGAEQAKGDVLIFLDADTILPMDFDDLIMTKLQDKNCVGGAFEFEFDRKTMALNMVVFLNRIRYRLRKRYYGDQAVFARKTDFWKVGGYPTIRIMETAHLCKNLQKVGHLSLIKKPIITSSRRFHENGIFTTFLNDSIIWFKDLIGLDVQKYADAYWQKNEI
ncbi:MAG: TIGR04283 family arsenosugar biosynthesis glycosyltransferase [Cyclobacteriaceae bacterium]